MFPLEIVADREGGTLSIAWDDGHRSTITVHTLRWACPCAVCRGEWGRPGRLSTLTHLPADELRLTDVRPVGTYGVTPVWASGHADGIYSFEYLRSLCACEECTAQRHST